VVLFITVKGGVATWIVGWVGDLLIAVLGGFSLISVAAESARIEPRNRLEIEIGRLENAKRDLARFLMDYSKQLPQVEFTSERPWANWALQVESAARQFPTEPEKILKAIDSDARKTFVYRDEHEEAFVISFVEYADFFANTYRAALASINDINKNVEPTEIEIFSIFLAPLLLAIATAIGIVKALV